VEKNLRGEWLTWVHLEKWSLNGGGGGALEFGLFF